MESCRYDRVSVTLEEMYGDFCIELFDELSGPTRKINAIASPPDKNQRLVTVSI